MTKTCICGDNKDDCVDCMKGFIENAMDLHIEVNRLCSLICNTTHPRTISEIGRIESMAFIIGHHPLIIGK